jgi:C4-dicarboxylate-specific signal transduction histidine kinase
MSEFDDLLKQYESPKDSNSTEDQTKPDILVIDDDESMRRGLTSALTHKYAITTANSGQKGIDILNKAFHCVILDVKMQDMNGFETYPRLKEKCPAVPIVFFTAFQSEHDLQEIINKYKPEGYIEKGRDISFLEHLIENAITKYHLILENEEYKKDLEKKVEERTEQYRKEKEKSENALIAQKKAEDEKTQALALSKTASLAAGIAHDVINAISTGAYKISDIKLKINAVLKTINQLSENEGVSSIINQTKIVDKILKIDNNIDGVSDSMQKVLYFSRILKGYSDKDRQKFKKISILKILSKTIKIANTEYSGLHTNYNINSDEYYVLGDPTGIYFVFQNMIENAFEAMKDQTDKQLWIGVEKQEESLVISFKDNGPGMEKDIVEQIYDPHYSTKGVNSVGHNRGLGLFTAKQTIDGHLGKIKLETVPNQGTEFLISLPIHE